MNFLKKGLKCIVSAIAIFSLVFSVGTSTFAATTDGLNENPVIYRAAICPSCHEGYLLSSTSSSGPYIIGSSVCSYRPDCFVQLYETYHIKNTSCSSCSFGYQETLNSTYSSVHSKYHL